MQFRNLKLPFTQVISHPHPHVTFSFVVLTKEVNTIPEAVPVWPTVRYISGTGQYRCTVLDLPL